MTTVCQPRIVPDLPEKHRCRKFLPTENRYAKLHVFEANESARDMHKLLTTSHQNLLFWVAINNHQKVQFVLS